MNYVSGLLTAVCASSIFIGALYMLCPQGNIQKSVSYILSLVFLLSVITAGKIAVKKPQIDFDMDMSQVDTTGLDTATAKYVYSYALQKAGIDFEEIIIYTDKNDSNSIFISKILVISAEEKEKIIKALSEAAKNIKVEVSNERNN